jgi:anti-sigma B factor antagonist
MARTELITLSGEIDMTRVSDLSAAVTLFDASDAADAVVDLTDVTFFGSEGVGLLARLHRIALDRQGSVTLINPNRNVLRVVEICGLLDLVGVERRFAPDLANEDDGSQVA